MTTAREMLGKREVWIKLVMMEASSEYPIVETSVQANGVLGSIGLSGLRS
jgi:hypothetical protein